MHQVGKKKDYRNIKVCSGNQRSGIRKTTNARECKPILCRFACDWKGSENRQAVTWKIILSLSVWHWLVLGGILALMLRNYSYSEKYEPHGHYSLGFVETWCRHETCQRKTTRVFFFPLKTMTNHAFVKKNKPQGKVYFTLQRKKWWCWWWWDGMGWQGSKQYEQECVGSVVGCFAMWVVN